MIDISDNDRSEVAAHLRKLAILFDVPMSDARLNAYMDVVTNHMRFVTGEELLAAVKKAGYTCDTFPTPAILESLVEH